MPFGPDHVLPESDLQPITVLYAQWTCLVCGGMEEIASDEEAPTPPICPSCHRLAVAEALAALAVVRR
ncbi:hypothetical protein HII36_14220 [Nonomuraea sp. NN258]|uniref:hypothetical protein n=1 Tax=Nonomuraea antri TaxID=2730852 RepID=UPI001569E5C7|nr:hypothetical protein [Nonomuraea antri]NRQ32987.1 hypothetical protein [Nonomuraea antri]